MRSAPLIISQAVVTLYAADANGDPLLAAPVWMGSRAEGIEVMDQFGEVESTPTGAPFPEHEMLGEYLEIQIERIWAIPLDTFRDYVLTREGYVMVAEWRDEATGVWHRRTFYGVKGRAYNFKSTDWRRQMLLTNQIFRARSMKVQGGATDEEGSEIDPGIPEPVEQALAFTFDDPIVAGDYLLSIYQFRTAVRIGFAKAIGRGDAGGATLTLELGGVLQTESLILASNAGEQSDEETFDALVPANTPIRWKATAGGGAALIGLTMNVTEE